MGICRDVIAFVLAMIAWMIAQDLWQSRLPSTIPLDIS